MATFGTTIGSGGFRFYDANHEVSYNYVAGVYGGNFQGPLVLDSGDAEGSSTNLAGHWRVVNAQVRNNVIVDCPEGVRIGNNYSLAPSGCTIDGNAVIRVATGQAVTQRIAPVSTTITPTNTYFATPAAGAFTQDSAGIWRKTGLGPRLTFLQAGDVGIHGDLDDSDGTGALVPSTTAPPVDTSTAAGALGWGVPDPVWSDEFDVNGVPNPAKWQLPGSDWAGHDGNGRRRPERQTVTDGRLVMTGLANGDSGWMAHRLNREYGRYEARVRSYNTGTSNGNLYSPVLLIWPTSNSRKADGEYDYYEPGSPGSTTLSGFMHFPGDGDQQREFTKPGVDLSQFHNIAFEWTPDHLKGFIDGVEWFSTSGGSDSTRRNIQDMGSGFATIQLDNFDGTNETPATFEVEWFRVYTLTPVTPPTGALTVTPAGIDSASGFGHPTVTGGMSTPPAGSHVTLLGVDTVLPFTLGYTAGEPPPAGGQTISGAGNIASAGAFGLPLLSVADGPQNVRALGIDSVAALGRPTVAAAPPPPTAPGGVLVPAVYAVDRTGKLVPLPAWTKLNVTPIRNSMGSLSIEYPAGAPGFSTLADGVGGHPLRALEVRIWLGGSQEGALGGWLTQKAGDDLVTGGSWSFTGHFHEWLLSKALIGPQPISAENTKGELRFASATAGLILTTIMDQAQARRALPLVVRDFTVTHDSNGVPWPTTVSSLNISPKTTVKQVTDKLVDLGMIEYELTAGRVWRAYAFGTMGVDRTTGEVPLTFAHAINLSQYSRRESAEDAGTAVLAAGSEGFYAWAESATAVAELGWRAEVAADAGQLSSETAVQAYAATQLEAVREGIAEFAGDVEFATGVPLPIVNWAIGDWAYTWVNNARRRLRIAQIDLTFSQDAPPRGTVVLNDLITNRVAALYRRLNAISTGDAVVGTSTPTPGGPGEDRSPPAAPTGLTLSSEIAYRVPGQILTLAVVSAGWAAVLTDAYPDAATAGKAEAAPLIAERISSGKPIFEDWTWSGAPSIVTEFNDALLEEFKATHSGQVDPGFPTRWLEEYPAAHQGGGPVTGDVEHYRLQYAYLGVQTVIALAGGSPTVPLDVTWVEPTGSPTRSTSLTFGDIEGGRAVGVRVAAVDRAGNQGPWSAVVAVDTKEDDQPPPIPSRPTVSTYLRTLVVTWDGKGASGEDMILAAPDFLSGGMVEVHVAEGIDFTPHRPLGAGERVDLSQSSTYKTNFMAAGTTNIADLTIGTTYFVRLVAVDRVGNASEPSETSEGVLPKQLVTIEYGPGTIDRQQIRQAAIGSAEIDQLAVNDIHVDNVSVGKLTAGTMNAQVVVGGRFSTPVVNGNKIEFDNAGIRLYQGNTVVGRWQVADSSMLVTGTYLSGLNGRRIHILPEGTLQFWPPAGTNFSQMTNDGQNVVWRGPIDNNGRSGRFNVNVLGVGMNFSTEAEVPNNLRSEIVCFDRRTRITSPFTNLEVDGKLTPPDGTRRRVQFSQTDSSGTELPFCFLSYGVSSSSGRGGMWGNGAGWKLEAGNMLVTDDDLNSFGPIKASDFVVSSARDTKRDVRDALAALDPRQILKAARAREFNYRDDPPGAKPRFGVIAEELPTALQRRTSDGKGGTELSVDLASQIGLLWAAFNQLIDEQDRPDPGGPPKEQPHA